MQKHSKRFFAWHHDFEDFFDLSETDNCSPHLSETDVDETRRDATYFFQGVSLINYILL
jgi:hypothetical protein